MQTKTSHADDLALSLVRGDALLRAQRAIGLVPKRGLGVGRRALVLALLGWAPIAVWALDSGLVVEGERERFREILRGVAHLRDTTLPWVGIVGLVLGWTLLSPSPGATHELIWAGEPASGSFGFAGFWYSWVARPLFAVLLLAWLWRLVLAFVGDRRSCHLARRQSNREAS